jgi:hypothetical protein
LTKHAGSAESRGIGSTRVLRREGGYGNLQSIIVGVIARPAVKMLCADGIYMIAMRDRKSIR